MIPPVKHASWAMMALSLALLIPPIIYILLAKRGRALFIRRIPGIDAIEEAVGRATELGRPIVFSTGLTGLSPLLYAILGILTHIGRKAAAYGCRLIVPQNDYEVMPVVETTVREAFRTAGRSDAFNPQDIRYLSGEQFAFASGYMGIVHREKAASCFLFGSFAAESLVLAEAGQQIGAMQVAGTPTYTQIPFFLTSCDYTIIGEEVYAAGAYLSREPAQLGSVRGQDVAKLVILGMMVAGVTVATVMAWRGRDQREGEAMNSPLARALYVLPQQNRVHAAVEVRPTYKPPKAPEREDLEGDLQRARVRLANQAGRTRSGLARVSEIAGREARNLRDGLEVFEAGAPRDEARVLAERLADISSRAEKEAEYLSGLAREALPATERQIAERRRDRAAELYRPEVKALAAWAAQWSGPEASVCQQLVAAADAAVGSGSAPAIEAAVRRARGACYSAYFAAVRARMNAVGAAAKEETPRFLLRTGQESKIFKELHRAEVTVRVTRELEATKDFQEITDPELRKKNLNAAIEGALGALAAKEGMAPTALLLDGGKSVSGRLLPLSYTWTVQPPAAGSAKGKIDNPRPQVPVTFVKPGRYTVDLTVSELPEKPRVLVLAIEGADATRIRQETAAAGAELKLSWRLPDRAIRETAAITWEFGDGSAEVRGEKGQGLAQSHAYARPGTYPMTVTIQYDEQPAPVPPRAAARGGSSAAAGLRVRLGESLKDLADRLSSINNERLSPIQEESEGYGAKLKDLPGLSDPVWPDRTLAAELDQRTRKLREWVEQTGKLLDDRARNIQNLGVAAPATGAQAPADGSARDAGQSAAARPISVWKRCRYYWKVVEPRSDSASLSLVVEEAPPELRAPWMAPAEEGGR